MNKRSPLHRWADDLLALFYPHLCRLCDRHLPTGAPAVCYRCRLKLPQTYFHQQAENAFTDRFLGRIPLRGGAAFLYFRKGGMAQHIIHQLKYKGKKQLGYDLGKLYGQQLKREGAFSDIDYLLPVPLHSRKLKKRGYNQSEWIARGLAEGLGKQVDTRVLTRKIHTTTQTRKSKEERWTNVAEAFQVGKSNVGGSSHFLLVDDVLTTGATLEACGTALLEELPNCRLSMVTLAFADY